jgi:hypothetical protein
VLPNDVTYWRPFDFVSVADHSPPSSAKVKEGVELHLHSPVGLHGVLLTLSTGTI